MLTKFVKKERAVIMWYLWKWYNQYKDIPMKFKSKNSIEIWQQCRLQCIKADCISKSTEVVNIYYIKERFAYYYNYDYVVNVEYTAMMNFKSYLIYFAGIIALWFGISMLSIIQFTDRIITKIVNGLTSVIGHL